MDWIGQKNFFWNQLKIAIFNSKIVVKGGGGGNVPYIELATHPQESKYSYSSNVTETVISSWPRKKYGTLCLYPDLILRNYHNSLLTPPPLAQISPLFLNIFINLPPPLASLFPLQPEQ